MGLYVRAPVCVYVHDALMHMHLCICVCTPVYVCMVCYTVYGMLCSCVYMCGVCLCVC